MYGVTEMKYIQISNILFLYHFTFDAVTYTAVRFLYVLYDRYGYIASIMCEKEEDIRLSTTASDAVACV